MDPIFTKEHLKHLPFSIGDFTYGKPDVRWWGEPVNLTIGKFCSLAKGVKIMLGGNHRTDWISTYPFSGRSLQQTFPEARDILGHPSSKGDILIGNDVWIAEDATIMSGTSIGDGAVIAAGAVVTKSVKPYEIVGGNPAKHINFRFSDDIIALLLEIKWWDWDIDIIRQRIPLLMSGDIDSLKSIANISTPLDLWPNKPHSLYIPDQRSSTSNLSHTRRSAPRHLRKFHFEIVKGCQLRCIGCPNATLTPKVHRISVDDFASCLDNVDVDQVELFRLFNFGEPLLHHDLAGILKAIPRKRINFSIIEISTNAQFARWDEFEEAIATRVLNRIAVSCDGDGSPEDYERMRPPSKWWKFIEFLERTKSLRDKYHPELKLITRSIVESPEHAKRWDEVLHSRGWAPEYRPGMALPDAPQSLASGKTPANTGPCQFLSNNDQLYVDWDGTVLPCCAHPKAGEWGSLRKDTYSNIILGKSRAGMLQQMTVDRSQVDVCNRCSL